MNTSRVKIFGFLLLLISANLSASVLVDVKWLKENINKPNVVVVDMSDSMQNKRFHIPGARHLPYGVINQRLKNGVSLKVSNKNFIAILGKLGITAKDHIVIYDDIGGLHGARLFWQLENIGHKKVSLLDGGLVSWILANNRVDNKLVTAKPTVYTPDNSAASRKNEIDTKSVGKLASSPTNSGVFLLDVRTQQEYVGHPKQKKSGHIPGARWWPWVFSVDMNNGFIRKDAKILLNSLSKVGVTKKTDPIVVYCHTGHRASQAYMTLRSLGFSNVRLYDGSILEYSKTQNMVFRKGLKP